MSLINPLAGNALYFSIYTVYQRQTIVLVSQPRPRPSLRWLWQVSLAGLVNFRLAFDIKKIKIKIKIEGLGLGCSSVCRVLPVNGLISRHGSIQSF